MQHVLESDLDHVLDRTEGLWEELRNQRLFITGGTGFFGRWLLESFFRANDRFDLRASALVLTRDPDAFRRRMPRLAFYRALELLGGDVRRYEYPAGDFGYVIHAAAPSSSELNTRDPLAMLDILIEGTRRTLDFAVARGARKFLLTSSGAVYGKQPPELSHVPEEYRGGPDTMDAGSAYAEGKRVAELLCAICHRSHGLQTKIARCFAFAGPYLPLDAHFAFGNFIRDGLSGGPIRVAGDGTPFRSYLYAADLAIWLWTILFRGASCRPYNVGSEHAVSIADLAGSVAGTMPPPVVIACTADPGRLPERYVPATRRAQTELDLSEAFDLEESIRRTADWALSARPASEEDR